MQAGNTTFVNVYIQLLNRRLLFYTNEEARPPHIAHNTWSPRYEPIGQIWEAFLRSDRSGYWAARHQLNNMVDTADSLSTATHLPSWLDKQPHAGHHNLLLACNIGAEWTPAPPYAHADLCAWEQYPAMLPTQGTQGAHTSHTHLRNTRRMYDALLPPRTSQWIPDPTEDGDVESNLGPVPDTTTGEGIVRTLAETFQQQSKTHTGNTALVAPAPNTGTHEPATITATPPPPSVEACDPLTSGNNTSDPATRTEETNTLDVPDAPNSIPRHGSRDNATLGFNYTPLATLSDPKGCMFHAPTDNPRQHIPTSAVPTENKLTEELVKLNTAKNQTSITDVEQQTIEIATISEAQAQFSAYLSKSHNRLVTTEHIRKQT